MAVLNPLSSCELYNPSTNSWSSTVSLATSRYWHAASLLASGKVLVMAGHNHTVPLSSCELFNDAGIPTTNVYTGNVTITTQSQMEAFYNTGSSACDGRKWSEIDGKLTIDGSHSSDPITSLGNLSELKIVKDNLVIQNFTNTYNPTDLYNFSKLVDCWRGIDN